MTRSGQAPRWRARPCLGTPLELWYGPESDDRRESPAERGWRELEALRLCADCPVRDACLADELSWGIANQWGVRGGMTAERRKALIRHGTDRDRRSA